MIPLQSKLLGEQLDKLTIHFNTEEEARRKNRAKIAPANFVRSLLNLENCDLRATRGTKNQKLM